MLVKLRLALAFLRGFVNGKLGKWLPKWGLHLIQKYRLKKFRRTVISRSPYYASFATSDFKSIPIIDKACHMKNFNHINTRNLDRDDLLDIAISSEKTRHFDNTYENYSVGMSSGTSGNRGLFVTNPYEQCEWAGFIIARVLPFTFRTRRVALFLRSNNNLYERSNGKLIQFKFFDLFQGIEANIPNLEEYCPHILVAPSSVLLKLMKENITISPEMVISVAEVLEENEKEKLQRHFRVPIQQIYQCTEGFLGSTCRFGNIHLNEDVLLIEKFWVDKPSGRFNPVITDLRRQTQPIIRYHLDDILQLADYECSCGNKGTHIAAIEGRMDDIIVMHKNNGDKTDIFPDFIRNAIIGACPMITDYQVVQSNSNNLDIKLQPMSSSICNEIRTALDGLLENHCIPPPTYNFGAISEPAYTIKRRRVISLYNG